MPALWWTSLLGVVVGAGLAFGIAEYRDAKERSRKRRGNFEALAVEIQICGELADGYLKGGVMAPAYRMPLTAYNKCFADLLTDGVLASAETNAVIRFYINVAAFNFAVDQAQIALMKRDDDEPTPRSRREASRAMLKASNICRSSEQYGAAIGVMRQHLPEESRARLAIPLGDLLKEERD